MDEYIFQVDSRHGPSSHDIHQPQFLHVIGDQTVGILTSGFFVASKMPHLCFVIAEEKLFTAKKEVDASSAKRYTFSSAGANMPKHPRTLMNKMRVSMIKGEWTNHVGQMYKEFLNSQCCCLAHLVSTGLFRNGHYFSLVASLDPFEAFLHQRFLLTKSKVQEYSLK